MTDDEPSDQRRDVDRVRYERSLSMLRGGGVGIALVVAGTAGLVVVAAVIALLLAALY